MSTPYLEQKNSIDSQLQHLEERYRSSILNIYGGMTEQSVEQRFRQHQRENPERFYRSMPPYFVPLTIHKTTNLNEAIELESYLIQRLKHYFGSRCWNEHQNGGTGIQPNQDNEYKLYLLIYYSRLV